MAGKSGLDPGKLGKTAFLGILGRFWGYFVRKMCRNFGRSILDPGLLGKRDFGLKILDPGLLGEFENGVKIPPKSKDFTGKMRDFRHF